MFFNKRISPDTAPSLVKSDAKTSGVSSGVGVTIPISDHVPELMKAHSSLSAVMAAKADAVS